MTQRRSIRRCAAILIQTWITTRADLNEAEENIVNGAAWARRRRGGAETLLNEDFSKSLHKQMFREVWKWAGGYRQNELNIGIAPHLIAAEMPVMFDNARFLGRAQDPSTG